MNPRRLALLSSALLCLAATAASADDPYAEYRIPEHRWLSWTGTLNASGGRSASEFFSQRFESSALSGSGASKLTGGFDSDARSHAYSLSLSVAGSGDRQTSHRDFAPDGFDDFDSRKDKDASERASGFLAFSRYPRSIPVGLTLGGNGTFGLSQSHGDFAHTFVEPPTERRSASNSSRGSYDAAAILNGSLSLGRVRDATPVYQVQVLEQRLLEVGTISRPLSPAGRERLAALYTVEGDVSFAHQRPTKYFWQELERILREDGVLGEGGLDAYSVQRLLEPLTIVGSGAVARARGFAFGPQILLRKTWLHLSFEASGSERVYDHDTLVVVNEGSTDQERNLHDESILSGLFLDYHRPIGMRWQVDALSQGLITESGDEIRWTNQASVNWLVADRWFATAGFLHALIAPGHGTERSPETWSVDYGASANYFLEDAWAFRLGWSGSQDRRFGFNRSDSFSLGVTYQFAGWLSAPAVFAPMRLAPPSQ